MSFAGLKKQFNKANQYMTEKIGGAECTKLDDDFVEMERKTDVTFELVDDLQLKTKEYLQPNPTARAKMAAVKGISKLSGQAKASTYPQPEGVLGECMLTFGKRLGDESVYAAALVEAGESFRMMADVKYTLDDNVKQNFLEPLHQLQTKDLKEVMHHRKKLQGRRLDFDCKKRRQTKGNANFKNSRGSPVPIQGQGQGGNNDFWPLTLGQGQSASCLSPDDEIKQAEDKFAESLHLAQMGMYNLLENDTEQVSQLTSFAECLLDYHKQCTEIIEGLVVTLQEKKQEADEKPRKEFIPKTVHDLQLHLDTDMDLEHKDHSMSATTPQRSPMASPSQRPADQTWFPGVGPNHNNQMSKSNCASPAESPMKSSPARTPSGPSCKALYDFDAENPGELGFKEGQTIHLTSRIDDNWYEGTVDGRSGYFPVTYVQITVPLP